MDVFEFIDKHVLRKLLPFIRLLTIYTNNGVVTSYCLVRYNDKKIVKKAAKLGLTEDRLIKTDGAGIKLGNQKPYDIQKGSYYLNYNTRTKELNIFRM